MAATVQWEILPALVSYPEQLFKSKQRTLTNAEIIGTINGNKWQ
jgi:hypothetical protein